MPSGKSAWHNVETQRGNDHLLGPQAFGNGAFKEHYHTTIQFASNLNTNFGRPPGFPKATPELNS
jgi:hypothetical protein